jgi:hypothetical protein
MRDPSWDQAIAELYSQVLTITHCPIGDDSVQGLRSDGFGQYNISIARPVGVVSVFGLPISG